DRPLLARAHAHGQPQRHGTRRHGVDPEQFGLLQDVGCDVLAFDAVEYGPQGDLAGAVDIGGRCDGYVDHGDRVALAHVADAQDLAVAAEPQGAVDVADGRHAQADRLDGAHRVAEVHHVAHTVLVLEQHEHARDEVPHEVLRTETKSNAGDTGRG